MILIILAIIGSLFVIGPQLITIRYHWLRYRNRMRYAGVKDLTADMAYEGTTKNIRIEDRWNNLGLQTLKKYSYAIGFILTVLSLILSFLHPNHYFTKVFDIVFGSLLWILLERYSMEVCFRNFQLKESIIIGVAVFAPFAIFVMMIVALYMLTFIHPIKTNHIELQSVILNLFNV